MYRLDEALYESVDFRLGGSVRGSMRRIGGNVHLGKAGSQVPCLVAVRIAGTAKSLI